MDSFISEIKPRIHTNGHEKFKSRNGRVYPSFYAVGKNGVPEGHFENSPAFERRGLAILPTSPAGTVEYGACRVATLAKTGSFQPSLRDSAFFQLGPGIEMPGYSQLFLRNRAPAQNEVSPRANSPRNFF
jgi:hypothetical protein